jgi:hypothetical protein
MPKKPSGARVDAALGFAVKSGWSAAVLLTGSVRSPQVADSRRIELSDPAIPESRQPYHDGFGTARADGAELTRLLDSVRRFGSQSVAALIATHVGAGHQLAGAGLVVGSLIDPDGIANEHIRIHAREGQLFRGVVHDSMVTHSLPCSIWREKDVYGVAAGALERSEQDLRATVRSLGRTVSGPWRAEQKLAAVAAWLALAAGRP